MERRETRSIQSAGAFSSLKGFLGGRTLPLKISVIYAGLGLTWVQLEHRVLGDSLILKDNLFILATSVLLFQLVDRGVAAVRRKEKTVRESEALLLKILETSPSGIVLVDGKGVISYANREAGRILRLEREQMVGLRYSELPLVVTSIDRRPLREGGFPSFGSVAGGESISDFECVVRRPDGARTVLSINAAPVRSDDGESGVVCSFRDVTERRKAQDLTMAKLSLAVEQSPIGIMITDAAGTVEYVNPRCAEITGYRREELLGTRPSAVCGCSPEKKLEIGEILRRGGEWTGECQSRRKDGSAFWEAVSVSPIRDADGVLTHYLWIRDEITERRRAAEEAKRQQARLAHANRMISLGMIASGVAHEINNPNNLIMFNAPMIMAAWKDADGILARRAAEDGDFPIGGLPYSEMREILPKLIDGVSDASRRIRDIAADLKDFARQGSWEHQPSRVDVNEVVRSAVAILQHEILKRCQNFRTLCDTGLPPVHGSVQQLEQVVVNLLMNALQALPDRKRGVTVSTVFNRESSVVEVRVQDEGTGMSEEVLRRLSEPFFTTRSESGGLGLGLSIAFSILKAHGGTLTFESEVGRGTTARVALPAADTRIQGSPEPSVAREEG